MLQARAHTMNTARTRLLMTNVEMRVGMATHKQWNKQDDECKAMMNKER
jgi:hypothetical protein